VRVNGVLLVSVDVTETYDTATVTVSDVGNVGESLAKYEHDIPEE